MAAHILIVDDDPLIGRLFQAALGKNGYRTTVALSGPAALAYLETNPVDAMLLDIMMADMDGIDVVTRIRQHPVHHGLPIVLLTARADEASRQRGLGAGANDYLVKPVAPDEVVQRIRLLLPEG